MWALGQGHFWPQGNYLNNLARGLLDEASYQISKTWALWFKRRRFLKVFPMFVCLIWGLTSPSTQYRSFWRCCFQFCGTFTRQWDEMTSQALSPKETNSVYMQWTVLLKHFAWAGLDALGGLPVLVCSRFQLCMEASCSPSISSSPNGQGRVFPM